MNKVCTTGTFIFDRHQLPLFSNFCNVNFLAKTMRISSFKGGKTFNQSDLKVILWVIRYEAVVQMLKALIGHHKDLR